MLRVEQIGLMIKQRRRISRSKQAVFCGKRHGVIVPREVCKGWGKKKGHDCQNACLEHKI